METSLEPGSYVIAVSGGVDSVSLLDLVYQQSQHTSLQLVVAHFNHGIRPDAADDEQFVRLLARQYDLPYVSAAAALGPNASEATAREARYRFLRQVQAEHQALAVVTAHHEDDVIETALLNLLRGTGRKGITALQDHLDLKRPLLGYAKRDLITYAQAHDLYWREDSTNADDHYKRNYVRHQLIPHLTPAARQRLVDLITDQRQLNAELDAYLDPLCQANELDRDWFTSLPTPVALEVMASWLRVHKLADFDRKTLMRLTRGASQLAPGKRLDIIRHHSLVIHKHSLALEGRER